MQINNILKSRIKNIHLIGIGGIGMSGIARVLASIGFCVTGSDIIESSEIKSLKNLGAKISIGHHKKNIEGADVVVFSSAIPNNNPEIIEAKLKHIPVIPRALMLAELMKLRCGIAIAGAHGKTTTTSIIGTLMHEVGLDPTVIIGGVINSIDSNAMVGQGQYLVTEADESDGTFLHLTPTIAVITNIDKEHLDFFKGGLEEILQKFKDFANNLPFYGLLVACADDPKVKKISENINRRCKTYGFSEEALYRAVNIRTVGIKTSFDLLIENKYHASFCINMVGLHNVLNSLAAIIVLEELGVKVKNLAPALESFSGVKRRFSVIGEINNIKVIDDYGHHPSEIKAVINAAKRSFPKSAIKVLFQPHRFTRTKALWDEFLTCFIEADFLVMTEIYPAQETQIENITSKNLVGNIINKIKIEAEFASNLYEGALKIVNKTNPGDLILMMGAGNITSIGPQIINNLRDKYS